MSRHIDGEDGHTAGICDRCAERFEQRVKDPEFKQRVADSIAELDAAMLAGGPPAAQQNYVVRLVGLVSTDVGVCASSPEAAAEKAEAWAQGKHDKDELNDLFLWDWQRDHRRGDTAWLSEDQTPRQNGSFRKTNQGESR